MRNFIIGTDWWTDCDDAVAMRILARAMREKKINILGIGINACMEYSAPSLDGFLNLEGLGHIPLGIDLNATDFGGNPPYQKRLSAYRKKYLANEDAENGVRLYRRILAAADEKVEIIEIGYLQLIADVLESKGDDISPKSGLELFREKVSKLWVMAGKWDEDPGKENNFCRNPRSCDAGERFCRLCPVPVTFLGWEIGFDVISGDTLKEGDYLKDALKDHGSGNGRSSWDPMLILLALIGDEEKAGYSTVQGTATVNPKTGENYFEKSPDGTHKFVVKAKDNDFYKNAINSLIE